METLEKGGKLWTYFTPFSSAPIVHYKCLSGSSFLSKYYYPNYKDEQVFYLTLFKIAADFLNN